MAEKDVATTVDEKDYEHHLTWRGWLSFIVIALSFSGVLKDMGPLSAFDFTVLVGKFGKISDTFTFIGKGGIGASEGFMFALTLMPTVILALGFVRAVESQGALLAAERVIRPFLRPLMGLPGYVGLALISSFTTTDVGAVITRDLALPRPTSAPLLRATLWKKAKLPTTNARFSLLISTRLPARWPTPLIAARR